MQKALLTMGIQCFGSTMDADAARKLGERFYPYDAHAIKNVEYYENTYGIHERVTYLNMHEQRELASRHFLNLGTFRYLLGLPEGEGSMAKSLRPVNIKGLDPGQFPNGAVIAEVRRKLAKRHGRAVAEVLKEIAARQESPESRGDERPTPPPAPKPPRRSGPKPIPRAAGWQDMDEEETLSDLLVCLKSETTK